MPVPIPRPSLSTAGERHLSRVPVILAAGGLPVLLFVAAFLAQSSLQPVSASKTSAVVAPVEIQDVDPTPTPSADEGLSVPSAVDASQQIPISFPLAPEPAPVESQAEAAPPNPIFPIAIMVENLVDARPQSGLARADVVYEALVEGGITRFMAVYVDGRSDVIGPVRSARHYFVWLAAEFNASYVHIGSSFQGYEALSAVKLTRLDETYGDPGFWRVNTRYVPHNAYTSTDLVRSSLDRVRHVTPGGLAGFRFRREAAPIQGQDAPELSIAYPGGYHVRYVYDPGDRAYRRYMEGLPHRDAETGEQVTPRNVVVQFVDAWLIPGDDAGRLDMDQLGEGRALFLRDGVVTEGHWQKPSYGNVTEWYDSDWQPIIFEPGKIWVQVIPPSGKVAY